MDNRHFISKLSLLAAFCLAFYIADKTVVQAGKKIEAENKAGYTRGLIKGARLAEQPNICKTKETYYQISFENDRPYIWSRGNRGQSATIAHFYHDRVEYKFQTPFSDGRRTLTTLEMKYGKIIRYCHIRITSRGKNCHSPLCEVEIYSSSGKIVDKI